MPLHIITGGAGFIGPTLAKALIGRGHHVALLDDLSRGNIENIADLLVDGRARFFNVDCAESDQIEAAIRACGERATEIWHLAANSDIMAGTSDLQIDVRRTFLTTVGVLLAARKLAIGTVHFASSSAVYGDLGSRQIDEDFGPLQPISFYGAMKLASEVQLRAAVEAFLPRANILRFPNVVGRPATHGVILDFIRRLQDDPRKLEVLGNGTQQKLYLHVEELVGAMLFIADHAKDRYFVVNIGPDDEGVTVSSIAEAVRDRVAPGAAINYGAERGGWIGDVPKFAYSIERLLALGWQPKITSRAAIERAIDEIAEQERAKTCRPSF